MRGLNKISGALFAECIFVILQFALAGCEKNEFKESSIAAGRILLKAHKMLKPRKLENIIEDGKIVSTVIMFDNTSAKEYLSSKQKPLHKYYSIIKQNFLFKSDQNDDSLYMLAFLNEMMYLLTSNPYEERCFYLEKIISKKKIDLSGWMREEVFAPFLTVGDRVDEWKVKTNDEKLRTIKEFLLVGYKEAGCN